MVLLCILWFPCPSTCCWVIVRLFYPEDRGKKALRHWRWISRRRSDEWGIFSASLVALVTIGNGKRKSLVRNNKKQNRSKCCTGAWIEVNVAGGKKMKGKRTRVVMENFFYPSFNSDPISISRSENQRVAWLMFCTIPVYKWHELFSMPWSMDRFYCTPVVHSSSSEREEQTTNNENDAGIITVIISLAVVFFMYACGTGRETREIGTDWRAGKQLYLKRRKQIQGSLM